MKTLAILLVSITISFNVSAQSEKVLVKTLVTTDVNKVSITMEGEIEVKTWTENYARLLIQIEHHNAHPNLLKILITNGRYNIETDTEDGVLRLSSESLKQPLVFGNNETILDETISYTIYVPEGITVQQQTTEQLVSN